jgi:hypothetical protein
MTAPTLFDEAGGDDAWCICIDDGAGGERIVRMVYSCADAEREVMTAAWRGVTAWYRPYSSYVRPEARRP